MLDERGYEWGLELTRAREGVERVEHHRHYNEASARAALHEQQRRIGLSLGGSPIVRTTGVRLVKRRVGDWEVAGDD